MIETMGEGKKRERGRERERERRKEKRKGKRGVSVRRPFCHKQNDERSDTRLHLPLILALIEEHVNLCIT